MKFIFIIGAFLLLSIVSFCEIPGEFEKLENIVRETGRIREEISMESQKWKSDKELLIEEKVLLVKESEFLDKEIEKMQKQNVSASSRYSEMVRKKEENEKFVQSLTPLLSKSIEKVDSFIKKLPEGIAKEMKVYLQKIENWEKLTNPQRLQTLLSFYSHIEKLNNTFHIGMEILGENEKKEYRVLYAGLATGFALSANRESSGILVFRDDEWKFERDDSIREKVSKAIDIFTKEQPSEWIELPFFKVR